MTDTLKTNCWYLERIVIKLITLCWTGNFVDVENVEMKVFMVGQRVL